MIILGEGGIGGTGNDKGYFLTEAALNAAYPVGEDGWFATVGTTDTIWVWDTDTTGWFDSGSSGGKFVDGTDPLDAVYLDNNVGIGTITPSEKLDVALNAGEKVVFTDRATGADRFLFSQSSGGAEGRFYMLNAAASSTVALFSEPLSGVGGYVNSGNFGIGTTSPQEILHIASLSDPNILVETDNGGDSGIDFMEAPTATLGVSKFGTTGSGFQIVHDGGENKLFIKSGTSATVNTRMTIDRTSGNVGIGTASPGAKLEVTSGLSSVTYLSQIGSSYINRGVKIGAIATIGAIQGYKLSDGTDQNLALNPTGGNVGIGTTSPGGKLDVSGSNVADDNNVVTGFSANLYNLYSRQKGNYAGISGTNYPLQLFSGTGPGIFEIYTQGTKTLVLGTNATERMRIDGTSGNVGIGTASPGAKLDVITSARVFNNVGANSIANLYVSVSKDGVGGGVPNIINIGGIRSQFTASGWNTAKVDLLGPGLTGYGNPTEYITFQSDGTNKIINTHNSWISGDGGAEGISIDNSGNVGIGTASPEQKLHVRGASGNTYIKVQDERSTTGDEAGILFSSANGATTSKGLVAFKETGAFAVGDLYFANNNTADSSDASYADAKMIIKSSGNVGIGTTSPNANLVVSNAGAEGIEIIPGITTNVELLQGYNRVGGTYTSFRGDFADYRFGIGTTEKVRIDSDGNVGIGTASPTALLHLAAGTATNPPLKLTAGVKLSTPEAGSIEYYNGKIYITNNAKQKAIDRTGDVQLSTVTVADTTTETTLYTAPIAANSLEAGNVFKVHCDGIVTNDSGTAGDEVTLRIYVGASETPVATLETNTRQLTDQDWHMSANATQRTIGASGQRAVHIHLEVGDATARGDITSMAGIATIDTTANMDIKITAQWASAETDNTISLYQGYTEYKN